MGVGVRTPSAFLINPAFPSPCRARYIFVKDVVFDKRNRVSEADPRSFAACKHFFFLTHGYSELLVIWIGPAHFLEKITMIFVLHSFIIILKTLFRKRW